MITPIEVKEQRISDLLTTAFEGGCNYWIDEIQYCIHGRTITAEEAKSAAKKIFLPPDVEKDGPPYCYFPLFVDEMESGILIIHGREEGGEEKQILNKTTIKRGLVEMAATYPKHFMDFLTEQDDADTADVFLQCCIFGRLIYG